MADVEQEQRTEQATPRRRAKSREDGDFPRSVDVVAAAVLLGALVAFAFAGGDMAWRMVDHTKTLLGNVDRGMRATSLPQTFALLGWLVIPVSAAGAACAMGAGLMQSGGQLSTALLRPDPSRLDPIRRFQELFLSTHALVEVGKALVKFAVVGTVAGLYLAAELQRIAAQPPAEAGDAIATTVSLLAGLGLRVGIAFALLAGLDWVIERFRHERRLRMTRQEVRQEMREEEGDPQLRRRRRQRHRELSRRRALTEVARADLVLVNPTEYAVALRYEAGRMRAPRVVAKGRLHLAERIREIARGAGVPIVREPPLTRLLYHSVEVGREIPVSVYRAVAEILAYVYRLRRAVSAGPRVRHEMAA